MAPTLGIVICSYQPKEAWLHDAIESIGDVADLVCLVDNGNSPPLAGAAVRLKENRGWLPGVNAGVQACSTDWIMLLDDDDLLIPENAAILKRALPGLKTDVISVACQLFGDNSSGRVFGCPLIYGELANFNHISAGSWFRKSAWQAAGGFQFEVAGDWYFWAWLAKKRFKFGHFDPPVYSHRVREDSTSAKWTKPELEKTQGLIRSLMDSRSK